MHDTTDPSALTGTAGPAEPSLPAGTITFMLTDVEGSTGMWREHPETMFKAAERHHEIIHGTVRRWGGALPRDQGEGDSVFAAFARATDAVGAAIDIQRAFEQEPWETGVELRIRMALHTGEAEVREGNYYGTTVSRTARIRALAWGGQTLLSQATKELVQDRLPAGAEMKDLGSHVLKDFQRAERVHQLCHPDLRVDFPPLRARETAPNNLPTMLTTFVGRSTEMNEVEKLLRESRLLTLTGTGGCGKTRLAIEVARNVLDAFEDGVHVVDLASLQDPTLVLPTIAQSLSIHESPGQSTFEGLRQFLQGKKFLLILDNFERVAEAGSIVVDMLAACPDLTVMNTSRASLRVGGEREFLVGPLGLTDPQTSSIDALNESEAVRLFVERAQAAAFVFNPSEDNIRTVAEICYRLDGLPLAIELAAAQVKLFPLEVLKERLSERSDALGAGVRDLPARQQTLRNLIDWDYELLLTEEQAVFRAMSVFANGFTFEAAQSVVRDFEGFDVFGGLGSLVDKSLLRHRPSGELESRFFMLQTIRDYALEALNASEEAERVRGRHGEFYTELAEVADSHLRGPDQVRWLAHLELEHDNMRAALRWAGAQDDPSTELRLAGALVTFWSTRGYLSEGRRWIDRALERTEGQTSAERAQLLSGAGVLERAHGDYKLARSHLVECLRLRRELGDDRGVAATLKDLANLHFDKGDLTGAHNLYEESLGIWRKLDDDFGVAQALNNLGVVAQIDGRLEEALEWLSESQKLFRSVGDKQGIARAMMNQGAVSRDLGDFDRAAGFLMDSLLLWRELGDKWDATDCLEDLAATYLAQGRFDSSATMFGTAAALREEIGAPRPPFEAETYEARLARLRLDLGESGFEAAWSAGAGMNLTDAVELALATRASGSATH